MFGRDEFFDKLNSISENISVYYAIDFENSMGISYYDMNRLSNELGVFFSNIFKSSQFIGVRLTEYFYLPSIILGIWKNNCCFAGIADQYKKQDTLHFLNFLGVKYLISDSCNNEYDGKLICKFAINEEEFFIFSREIRVAVDLGLKDICYGIMTSGSTGKPKIIQVPWTCILANAIELGEKFHLKQNDCVFQASPYTFDPFFIELFLALLNGCSLLIVPSSEKLNSSYLVHVLFNSDHNDYNYFIPVNTPVLDVKTESKNENYFQVNLQQVKHKKVSCLQMTPSIFKRWTEEEIQNFILSPNSPLRILVLGGEKFPKRIFGLKSSNNSTRIFNIYGISEISCWAFLKEVTNAQPEAEISLGKPLSNILYKISENNELEIGSDCKICLVNNEKIFPNKKPVFRCTGDIVKLCNEEIYFVKRSNQIIKKYGIKIDLAKLEELFLIYNKQIKECYCTFDEENFTLGCFFVPTVFSTPNLNYVIMSVTDFNKHYIFPTKELRSIEKPDYLIEIKEPPLNCHGKSDKQKLLLFLKNTLMADISRSNTDIKKTFQKILMEVLSISQIKQPNSSFLDLGGNSVLALNLIRRLEDIGLNVSQEFISELLNGKGFDDCLKYLSFEKKLVPNKKPKYDIEIKLLIKWKFDLGKCVDATPAVFVDQGVKKIIIGSHSSQLSCINADSGSEIWTIFLEDRIESGFTTTKDRTKGFVGCYDHHIYCISICDGKIIWKFKTGNIVKSTPCLSSNEDILYASSYDTNLYLLSPVNGEMKTSLKLSNKGIFCSGITCASLNNFYIGTLDGTCISLNQDSHRLSWKLKFESPIFASPCLIPDKCEIIFSEVVGNIHLINALNGVKMWVFRADGNIYSTPIYKKDCRQILFGCHDSHLYCLQYEKELNLKWKQPLQSPIFAKPTIMEPSLVCVSTTQGFIYLLSSLTGSVLGRLILDGEVFSSTVNSDNQLIVGCRDNNVYCIIAKKKNS